MSDGRESSEGKGFRVYGLALELLKLVCGAETHIQDPAMLLAPLAQTGLCLRSPLNCVVSVWHSLKYCPNGLSFVSMLLSYDVLCPITALLHEGQQLSSS